MTNKSTSILYALSDWYNNSRVKSATFYKADNGKVNMIIKNKHGRIVYRKKLNLIGVPELESNLWWGYSGATFEEAYATGKEVDAYFDRRKKKGKRGGLGKKFELQDAINGGQIINQILDKEFWND